MPNRIPAGVSLSTALSPGAAATPAGTAAPAAGAAAPGGVRAAGAVGRSEIGTRSITPPRVRLFLPEGAAERARGLRFRSRRAPRCRGGHLEWGTVRCILPAHPPRLRRAPVSNSAESTSSRPLRVAIVGAGPAGVYAADILTKSNEVKDGDFQVSIDLFEAYPAPYGLIRYGVAPDHPRIKGIVNALHKVLDRGDIRFLGNVTYGRDLTLHDFRSFYDAVIFSTGAIKDADLNIPGIELEGSFGGADFVSWYDGHPDVPREWPLDAKEVAVIGNGNVALDVARMLVKHAEELLVTEIPDNVYQGLKDSPVTDVHVFGRRGPAQVKFTPLELRELSHMD